MKEERKEGRKGLFCPDFLSPALATVDGVLPGAMRPGVRGTSEEQRKAKLSGKLVQGSLLPISHRTLEFSMLQCLTFKTRLSIVAYFLYNYFED